ncbi:MAG: thermonuclease family protein [Pirellulales bacterium]
MPDSDGLPPPSVIASLDTKEFEGKVVGIHAGDLITVRDGAALRKVRLDGIDAPDHHQKYAAQARTALGSLVSQKEVTIKWRTLDQYQQVVGHVYRDGKWINRQLVQQGWAWHFKYRNNSRKLAEAEIEARQGGLGLWQDSSAIPPWEWRTMHREFASESPAKKESDPPATKPPSVHYDIVRRWTIPNGGEGKVVLVSPSVATTTGLAELAHVLREETRADRNAVIMIFDHQRAAAMYSRAVELDGEEAEFYDRHFVGSYIQNATTGYHEMQVHASGLSGPSSAIKF